MWTWADGFQVLMVLSVGPVAYVLVALENGRRERAERQAARDAVRAATRAAFFASRGGA